MSAFDSADFRVVCDILFMERLTNLIFVKEIYVTRQSLQRSVADGVLELWPLTDSSCDSA
jgi:hypothetical protein